MTYTQDTTGPLACPRDHVGCGAWSIHSTLLVMTEPRQIRHTFTTVQVARVFVRSPDAEHWGAEVIDLTGSEPGSIYPILNRFEASGWIEGEDEPLGYDHPGPRRKLYRVTESGLTEMRAMVERWERRRTRE